MLTVISPAKKLDFAEATPQIPTSLPMFQADAISLSNTAKRLSIANLRKLMAISEPLAKLNQNRFKDFSENPAVDKSKAAALTFAGDTYQGLEAATLDADEMAYAQQHLRILSGLYGLLRPMDLMQAYRLEMGSRLATRRGKNLYQYWGMRLSQTLNDEAAASGSTMLLNCASVEYFSAINPDALNLRVLTPVFMEERDGSAKIVSFFAKRARGAMARFAVQNRIKDPEGIKEFTTGGYGYNKALSKGDRMIFTRAYPDK